MNPTASIFHRAANPLKIIGLFGWIALVSIVVGAVIPGLVAYKYDVFFYAGTENQVRKLLPEVVKELDKFAKEQSDANQKISDIDKNILEAKVPGQSASALLALRRRAEASIRPYPISIRCFYRHILMYFWPTMFCGLATAIFILGPIASGTRFDIREIVAARTLWIAVGILISFIGPFYFRVFGAPTFADGRTVYAYCNWDISFWGFVVQSLHFVLMSWLLAMVWSKWCSIAASQRSRLAQQIDTAEASFEILSELSRQFYLGNLLSFLFRQVSHFIQGSSGFRSYGTTITVSGLRALPRTCSGLSHSA